MSQVLEPAALKPQILEAPAMAEPCVAPISCVKCGRQCDQMLEGQCLSGVSRMGKTEFYCSWHLE